MRPARARGCSASWRRRARSGARPAWRCAPNGSEVFCAKRGGPCVPADCCCTAPVPSTLRRTKGYCATSWCGRPARPNLPNGSRSIRRGASCAARRAISRPSASIPTGWRARAFSRRRCANVPPAASGGECPDRSATRWRGPTAVPCRSWSGGWRSPKRCGSLLWAVRSTAIGSRRRRPWRCFRVC